MAYEYLTARVTLQKKNPQWKSIFFFFLNGNLGKAFSLTKNTMNYPELNLLSTLAGRGKKRLQFLTVLRVWERVFYVHGGVYAFVIYRLGSFSCSQRCWLEPLFVWCDAPLGTARIYVYSMCFCSHKGIFPPVMLINLISKSRNMKQELKNRPPLWLDVRQYTLSQFLFLPSQLFPLSDRKTF